MRKTLIQSTKSFIKTIEQKIGIRNLNELELNARNILAEFQELTELHKVISDLIGKQLDLSDDFKSREIRHWQKIETSNWISLHEDYHNKRDHFFRKVDNFLNHCYSFTNFLSEILYQTLPHSSRKSVNNGTFHKMFNSIENLPNHPYFSLLKKAKQIIKTNEYRSIVLNHRKLQGNQVLVVDKKGPTQKSIIKLESVTKPFKFEDEVEVPNDSPDDIVIYSTTKKGGRISNKTHIVHMMVGSSKLQPDQEIHYLPLVPFDYYKHLEKYGQHWHEFTRKDNKNISDLFYSSGEVILSTPDLLSSMELIQKFVEHSTEIVNNI